MEEVFKKLFNNKNFTLYKVLYSNNKERANSRGIVSLLPRNLKNYKKRRRKEEERKKDE